MNTYKGMRTKLQSQRTKQMGITTDYLHNKLGKTKDEISQIMNLSKVRVYELLLSSNKLSVNYNDELV